tara:strand:+ start:109 stop:300 length:192 start_codon:yes stop_codon:yes gene_type:complete
MGRNKENIFKAKRQAKTITKVQLKKWQVNYNQLIFAKPSFDIYVDDKNIDFKNNWSKILKKYL